MSRWDEIWERAVDAAAKPGESPVGLATVAADGEYAVALSVADAHDVGRLLLLKRRGGSFAPWAEPVTEPLSSYRRLPDDSMSRLSWTVGPVRVKADGLVVWAAAGELSQPVAAVGIRVGDRLAMGSVHDRYFSAVHVGAAPELTEIWICGFASDRESEVWSVRMTAANEISDLD